MKLEAGTEDQFFAQTPRTYRRIIRGRVAALERHRKERLGQAWDIAALSRTKVLRPKREVLGEDRNARAGQSAEQDLANARRWHAVLTAREAARRKPATPPPTTQNEGGDAWLETL